VAYRHAWIGDSTPFDACSVTRSVRHPGSHASILPRDLYRSLDHPDDPCGPDAARARCASTWPRLVTVDSVSLADTTAEVRL